MEPVIAKPRPHNPGAERMLLGAFLISAKDSDVAFDFGRAGRFLLPLNRAIASALANLRGAAAPADMLAFHDALNVSGQLEAAGGIGYVAQLR